MHSVLLQKSYTITSTIIQTASKLPKIFRYSFGERLQNTCFDLLENICRAEISPPVLQDGILLHCHAKIHFIKLLLRLALERKIIEAKFYFEQNNNLVELEKIISGWRSSLVGRK